MWHRIAELDRPAFSSVDYRIIGLEEAIKPLNVIMHESQLREPRERERELFSSEDMTSIFNTDYLTLTL